MTSRMEPLYLKQMELSDDTVLKAREDMKSQTRVGGQPGIGADPPCPSWERRRRAAGGGGRRWRGARRGVPVGAVCLAILGARDAVRGLALPPARGQPRGEPRHRSCRVSALCTKQGRGR